MMAPGPAKKLIVFPSDDCHCLRMEVHVSEADMPGYDAQVIMAAGAFTLGSSIELSADAPLREPYAAWMQGGINFHSAKTGVLLAVQSMIRRGALVLK